MRREIDGANESKGRAPALQKSTDMRHRARAHAKHNGPDGERDNADRDRIFGAPTIKRSAGDKRKDGVCIIIKPEQRTHAQRRQPERLPKLR